jgi:uncharacterized protein HemX
MTSATEIKGWDISKPRALAILAIVVVIAGFAYWVSHNAGAARSAFEQQRRNEIAEENRSVCERWGQPAGTQKHRECITDLQQIREQHEKRIMSDADTL